LECFFFCYLLSAGDFFLPRNINIKTMPIPAATNTYQGIKLINPVWAAA